MKLTQEINESRLAATETSAAVAEGAGDIAKAASIRTAFRPFSIDEAAMGFIKVANEAMCRPIRNLTQVSSDRNVALSHLLISSSALNKAEIYIYPSCKRTQMKGYDITTHVLACFGGAGPQHAAAMANALGCAVFYE